MLLSGTSSSSWVWVGRGPDWRRLLEFDCLFQLFELLRSLLRQLANRRLRGGALVRRLGQARLHGLPAVGLFRALQLAQQRLLLHSTRHQFRERFFARILLPLHISNERVIPRVKLCLRRFQRAL